MEKKIDKEMDIKGKELDIELMRCKQTQCGFYKLGGCKNCKDCNADPYIIKKSCQTCIDCMTVPDFVRFGDRENLNKQSTGVIEKEPEAPDEVMIPLQNGQLLIGRRRL